jgi:6-phosphogluconolactonase
MVQTNGANTVPVSGNGTVLLATLNSGTSYTVTVSAQPTALSQTCTVTGPGPNTLTANVVLPITCVTNTYAMTANVSGLAGTGMKVQINSLTAVSVTAPGGSNIALGSLASGTAYTVTVTQPTGPTQACVPTPASGTVTTAAVAIGVVCTTTKFTVNAAVSGLNASGSGLVLQDNGGDNLTVTTSGTDPFATQVASGGAYAVTVHTQPTNPGQFCTVTNGSGTIGAVAVTATVTCRTEGVFAFVADSAAGTVTAFTIDDTNTSTAGTLAQVATGGVATAAAGSNPVGIVAKPAGAGAYYVYTADNGTADVTQYAVTPAGLISVVGTTPTGQAGSTPTGIAIDPSGNFLLVTDSLGNVGDGLIEVFQIAAIGGTLTQVVNSPFLTAPTVDTGVGPSSVAVDPSDSYVYAANTYDPGLGLAGFTFDPSTVDTTPGNLTAFTTANLPTGNAPVSVTVDPLDRFVYVANSNIAATPGGGTLSGWTIAAGALNPITGTPFNGGTGGFAASATPAGLAINPVGQFLYATDSTNNDVIAFTINQTTGAPTALATGSTIGAGLGAVPIVMDPSGRFVYVGNTIDNTISMYYADPTTGELSVITTPLGFSGMGPNAIAIQ